MPNVTVLSLLGKKKFRLSCRNAKTVCLPLPKSHSLTLTTEGFKASFCLSLLLPSPALLESLVQGGNLYSLSVSGLIKKGAHLGLSLGGFWKLTPGRWGWQRRINPGILRGVSQARSIPFRAPARRGSGNTIIQGKGSERCVMHFNINAFCPQ